MPRGSGHSAPRETMLSASRAGRVVATESFEQRMPTLPSMLLFAAARSDSVFRPARSAAGSLGTDTIPSRGRLAIRARPRPASRASPGARRGSTKAWRWTEEPAFDLVRIRAHGHDISVTTCATPKSQRRPGRRGRRQAAVPRHGPGRPQVVVGTDFALRESSISSAAARRSRALDGFRRHLRLREAPPGPARLRVKSG